MKPYQFINDIKSLNCVQKIILFGSRARKDHAPRADIDIAIDCPTATQKDWIKILDIIESADMLLKIDCIRLDELPTHSSLIKNIKKDGVILYGKTKA